MARNRNDVQTAVRMPTDLYERLQAAAGDRPLGEEIRRRLEASFEGGPPAAADPSTTTLLDHINTLAQIVQANYGNWKTDPGAFAVFRLAVDKSLSETKPGGEPKLEPKPDAISVLRDVKTIEEAANMAAFAALWWLPGDKP